MCWFVVAWLMYWSVAVLFLLRWKTTNVTACDSSLNACCVCIWQVCPPVVCLGFDMLHPHNISLRVPALYGMGTALRRVIGYWQIVLPVGRFSVHSWFPFFSEPPTLPSQLLFICTWTRNTHTELRHSLTHLSTTSTVAFFGPIVRPLLVICTHIQYIQLERIVWRHMLPVKTQTASLSMVVGVTFPVWQLKRIMNNSILLPHFQCCTMYTYRRIYV